MNNEHFFLSYAQNSYSWEQKNIKFVTYNASRTSSDEYACNQLSAEFPEQYYLSRPWWRWVLESRMLYYSPLLLSVTKYLHEHIHKRHLEWF